ncbi:MULTISPECIES: YegP family protein [Robiginitalea]|uniref:DUF1508 domain-containing protein n=1 Tax=Robiginitalea biformata (strain ATCC BAA-864 / DSM 15991 / KCTC 12146 / HTCC2501) TaxID=313596 RepID=A4CH83_ROBBH|nr:MULTISPECIES: YegP family protein [Robiginitalea]EAR16291.1 hypothetical protein RB2501_05315 [Robiginitalea biformata HTCC2501]MDC6353437.1 YegP family protein [Robiginitalea sp. PM2]MDC6373398.1 YegP family protein [Robiginitalea sp. SP8]
MGKFEITQDKSGKFRFKLKARNGQIILSSQAYTTKSAAEKGIESVKINSNNISRIIRKRSNDGKFYFNLKAANGQIIGTSPLYNSKTGREGSIHTLKESKEVETST